MKKLIALMALSSLALTAFGQGVVQFQNRDGSVGISAPIYLDVVGAGTVGALSGTSYRAALLGGSTAAAGWVVTPTGVTGGLGMSMAVSPTTGDTWVNFRTGAASGFVNVGADAARAVTTVDWNTTGQYQIVAWSGNYTTWADAVAAALTDSTVKIGASAILSLKTPTGPSDQALTTLQGLNSFAIVSIVPEPSTFALAGLGAAAMLIFRRRK